MQNSMEPDVLKKRIIFRRIIQGLIILGIFLMAITNINHENDIFWQIRMGEEIVLRHHFPTRDIFSLPAYGEIWTLHEWLPSVIFYLIYTYCGAGYLIIFKALVIAATFLFFLLLFNRHKVNLYLSFLTLGLTALVNTRGLWVVFPSIFEYFFLALGLYIIEIYTESKSKYVLMSIIILNIFWVNSHGSFFLLTAILGAIIFGSLFSEWLQKKLSFYKPYGFIAEIKERKMLLVPFFASLVIPLATPSGYWTAIYPFRISFSSFTAYVSEYQKFWHVWNWNWADFVHGITLILMISIVVLFLLSIKHLNIIDLLLFIIFSGLALSAVRHVAIFALAALYIIARYISFWFGEYRGIFKRTLLKDILLIIFIIFFIYYYKLNIVGFGLSFSEDGYPKKIAELINENSLSGNMFNHYNYGGYLIWKMPKYKVFIDGRLEMYGGKTGEDYETILSARDGYKELLDKYQINFFVNYLLDGITEKLVDDPGWKYIYHDDQFVLFVKDNPQNYDFISKNWSKKNEEDFHQAYKVMLVKLRTQYYNERGIEALKKKDIILALNSFQKAVETNPEDLTSRLNLAQAYKDFGTLEQAKREYEEILEEIDPDNQIAKENIEKIDLLLKNMEERRIIY
jgi:hypothetical protein